MTVERLDKLIASRTNVSRKEARALVHRGLVRHNGRLMTDPEAQCAPEDEVLVEGRRLNLSTHLYLMLNKPVGVVCATRDNLHGTVLDLVPPEHRRKGLFPAGRLDRDTEGLVLITDDGAFSHRILAPRSHIPKTYEATLDAPIDLETAAAAFLQGVDLGGGDSTSPAQLRLLQDGERPIVELTIYEGIYHQVKRMFALFGRQVVALRRVRMGDLALDPALPPGTCRELTTEELEKIVQPGALAK